MAEWSRWETLDRCSPCRPLCPLAGVPHVQETEVPELQLRVLAPPTDRLLLVRASQPDATMYKSLLPNYAARLRETGRAVAVIGPSWVYGILGWPTAGVTAAPRKPKKGEAAAVPAPAAATPAEAAASPVPTEARWDPHVLEPIVAMPNAEGLSRSVMNGGASPIDAPSP